MLTILGIHEVTFRIGQSQWVGITLGVVPAKTAVQSDNSAYTFGHMYIYFGRLCSQGREAATCPGYGEGDLITVRLDLDAGSVTFRKNGNGVGPPQDIASADAYNFAFDGYLEGINVTIVDDDTM